VAIDVLFAIIVAFAIYRGFTRGLIVAVFSLLALVIGLAAALKLSAHVANWISDMGYTGKLVPIISFSLTFVAVVILVRLGAMAIQRLVHWTLLGWVNRLGGILLYGFAFTLLYSVVLWFANQVHVLTPELKLQSAVYPYLESLGPWTISWLGKLIPWFQDSFKELELFFEKASLPWQPSNQVSSYL
jgi:membrane protein required for colicin V production